MICPSRLTSVGSVRSRIENFMPASPCHAVATLRANVSTHRSKGYIHCLINLGTWGWGWKCGPLETLGFFGSPTRLTTLPQALFFFLQKNGHHIFESPTRLTTLPQALFFPRKMAPAILEHHGSTCPPPPSGPEVNSTIN